MKSIPALGTYPSDATIVRCDCDRNMHRFDFVVLGDDFKLTIYERASVPGGWETNLTHLSSVKAAFNRASREGDGTYPIFTTRNRNTDVRVSVPADRVLILKHYLPEI